MGLDSMFDIVETSIQGCFHISPKVRKDARGFFVKTYHEPTFSKAGLSRNFVEEYYSVSHKNVLRGMHFQKKPFQHDKLVYCPQGSVIDVVLDLRKESVTFKQFLSFELNEDNSNILFIPEGCAHGFLSLEDNTLMMYKVTTVYNPDNDSGILWNSFEFSWPVDTPVISGRDSSFATLADYKEFF